MLTEKRLFQPNNPCGEFLFLIKQRAVAFLSLTFKKKSTTILTKSKSL